MLMTYLGTLKTWVYWPIFLFWSPSPASIRIPMLVAGAASIWCFYMLLKLVLGSRTAMVGALLLATDTTYLLTTCFDWGPVALQHLLMLAGLVFTVRFYRKGGATELAAAFFCFGLAMWDKALFSWALSGLLVAALAVFPRALRRCATPRNLTVAAMAFLAGATPFIIYNIQKHLETFRGNTSFSTEDLGQKAHLLRITLEGSALFGYLVYDDWIDQPKQPASGLERESVRAARQFGERRSNYLPAAFALSLLLAPLWWPNRGVRDAICFGLVFLATAWGQMLFTRGAGAAAHHIVLLWPFPQFIVAAALTGAASRARRFGSALLAVAITVLVAQNLLVTNQYLGQLIRDGASGSWTDAIYPLAKALENTTASKIWVIDWGMLNSLRLLDRGSLPLQVGDEPLHSAQPNDGDRQQVLAMLQSRKALFLGHVPNQEIFSGVGAHLSAMAIQAGYRKVLLNTVLDSNGRPIFELFRFVPAAE